MSLTKGKHIVEEINGIRCTIVEKGTKKERVDFLKELLETNKFEVKVSEDKKPDNSDETTYTIGVTDIMFNPVYAIYERTLLSKEGKKISPAYWNQVSDTVDLRYWRKPRKKIKN